MNRAKLPRGLFLTLVIPAMLLAASDAFETPPSRGDAGSAADEPLAGLAGVYAATIKSPGGPLPFELVIATEDGHAAAHVVNGAGIERATSVEWVDDELRIRFDHYDSFIRARRVAPDRLTGEFRRLRRADHWAELAFEAHRGQPSGFPAADQPDPLIELGRWAVRFSSSDNPAVLELSAGGGAPAVVTGTIRATTGDYRYLAGRRDGGLLRLSAFDGCVSLLFIARLDSDGGLNGDFWSGDHWHNTWTARRDDAAALPDAFELTRVENPDIIETLRYRDLDGREVSLGDPEFIGRPRLIYLTGSWCPNCHDAAPLLKELQRDFGPRGLTIIALSFELTGDFERDARQARTYVDRHDVTYPVLLAGVADRQASARSFPALDQIRAYPTFLFIDRRGRPMAVYTGFSGPATSEYPALVERFRNLAERLVE